MASTKNLNNYISQIESYIPKYEFENPKVSKSSIGWHLDHSLKVINSVIDTLEKSNPAEYQNNFSFLGKVFFTLGFFPRGKAKAPKYVLPPDDITKEDLLAQLETTKTNIDVINKLDNNAYFKHPLFGHINTKRVNRFLILHTNHHLKIIRDILK
ncbi:DUF1569 domain-containing protein [Winogradskyella sp.]|uniref:DUF1569 domain-containing protein n=1 Tax=Winogradskyella sp. TaxID=1883156 RepID=UPI001B282F45|nr:DUF1569 domain-containing protein [Winogradskyella sp.]MBO6880845.1 DinB family protein [Winogradskyella sp.]